MPGVIPREGKGGKEERGGLEHSDLRGDMLPKLLSNITNTVYSHMWSSKIHVHIYLSFVRSCA